MTYSTWKYVDSGKEAEDLFIMNHAQTGDIVITQDIS
ncbi:DUF188 domain-containing protein [Neobacillus bataviensis]|nr:DUF188 domain-containing protein [Neobacillus bataviensis]